MSLDPHFASAAFGLMVCAQHLLAALAAAILLLGCRNAALLPADREARRLLDAFAGLLTGGVLLWAYISFMQYLVVWSGNLPAEAAWYLRRASGGWAVVAWVLALLTALPVVMLALPAGRRTPARIAAIAGLIVAVHVLAAVWLILPAFAWSWLQPIALAGALLGLGGLCVFGVLLQAGRPALRPAAGRGAAHG